MKTRPAWQQPLLAMLLLCLPGKTPWSADNHQDTAAPSRLPAIALIIDDLGAQLGKGRRAVNLPGPVAVSFLPGGEHTAELARLAHDRDKEVMLHMPMQALGQKTRHHHAGELMAEMPQPEFLDTLARNIAAVPHVSGINKQARCGVASGGRDNCEWCTWRRSTANANISISRHD